jgi:hypothetical protein
MASRGPTSFQKKQKEDKRREKQREKLARRLERKDQPNEAEPEIVAGPQPRDEDF